ncbi:MAG: polyamine ABC transporter substrate-binding protein [Candidatus Anaerobiospirillum merdipullorum]|uniref:Putrescine-binding periplasmic protein n=1 Tax=Candidatus Anaerobiospirillum merdipullorum TaxID=2838450 RepID=A0A9E2KMD1_9GAMM|nr:polyamine ABC transporter substrate-binding protein [Candidatus Anaerobiospirillum merdipullorum]
MKKLNQSLAFFSCLTAGLVMGTAQAAEVNIWNWSDYIAQNTVADFEKELNIETNYALFDSNEMVEARLLSGHSGFDACMMTSYYVPRLAKAGALEKIDKSKIPNWSHLDENRMKILAQLDPNNDYAYPYTEISVGIGYNKEKIAEIFGPDYKVDSWDFLFKKENSDKLKQCGIAILDSPIEVISTVMHYLGKDPNSEKASDYTEAQEILTKLASNVAYFHSSRFINDLASGEICVAVGYSGDILQAADRAKQANRGYTIDFVMPKEGTLLWYDCWTIPAGAENYDEAHAWFNYLMDDKVAASISNEIKYILPVKGAIANLGDDLKNNPNINLSPEKLATTYFPKPTSNKVSRITNRVWNSMKLNSESEEGSGWE